MAATIEFSQEQNREPLYTVTQVSKMLNISPHTIRYYSDLGFVPFLARSQSKIRLYSDFDLGWLRTVQMLRMTGMPISDIKHYIELCIKGKSTIKERANIIFAQEKPLRMKIHDLQEQMKMLQLKKQYYIDLLKSQTSQQEDLCNPMVNGKTLSKCLLSAKKKGAKEK